MSGKFMNAPAASYEFVDGAHAPELKAKAYELFQQGLGYRSCARILNVSIYTVRDWKRHFNNGTFSPENGFRRSKRTFTTEFKRQVVEVFLSEKLTINQAAQRFKVTRRSISQWVELYGTDESSSSAQ